MVEDMNTTDDSRALDARRENADGFNKRIEVLRERRDRIPRRGSPAERKARKEINRQIRMYSIERTAEAKRIDEKIRADLEEAEMQRIRDKRRKEEAAKAAKDKARALEILEKLGDDVKEPELRAAAKNLSPPVGDQLILLFNDRAKQSLEINEDFEDDDEER